MGQLAGGARAANFEAMSESRLNQALAAGVLAIALFNTLSGLSQPARERPPALWLVLLWAALLVVHAAAYWYSARLRARMGTGRYFAGQAALVFAIGVSGAFFPLSVALYLALTMYAVVIAGERWGTLRITLGAIGLFALSAMLTSNLYQGSMAGLMLAAAGIVSHAMTALLRHRSSAIPTEARDLHAVIPSADTDLHAARFGLTARETEILSALTQGARNSEIAERFGIAERTVKAHLARIYDKLGVDSRAAAIAIVLRADRP
ncbi:MAG TPA: LuxR C-terminal-related transcriptional regulator [Gemmatimonadaceae bacterium]|nr:LuxR C-terminal-related transcriptional regulator [Gemmatimonadaceae bacterium]